MSDAIDVQARELARRAHEGQEYGGGPFFDNHLSRVVATLERYGENDPLLKAVAWLHDAVEDTALTIEEIGDQLGAELADLVWRLTDEQNGSRAQRQSRTHEKIREDTRAVRVKLADRIANVESARERGSPLMGMYRQEHPQFRSELQRPGEFEAMWRDLDRAVARA
ncbi:MAG TPA: HD domain-containing protein, partial [Longimicrobiales bacterium]|nr:HD domain-containing protein [Longimicrobiales bacterium]